LISLGSFGHFQAHQYNLKHGGGENWVIGVSKTRRSVLKLNHIILEKHCEVGLPCVSVSPFPTVSTSQKSISSIGSLGMISSLMKQGFIPITHGDVVIDSSNRCSIFSGDKIMEWSTFQFHGAHSG
jgi:isopentenyl phosphate kinase